MLVGTCLDCEEHIELDDDADCDDIIECPKCASRFEIIDLDPVVLESVIKKTPVK
jgi:lysine biosynthesis protein LysW